MELTKVSLIIVSAETMEENNNFMYRPEEHGKVFSTPNEILVNKVPDGYSILYTDKDLKQLDIMQFSSELTILLIDNIPNGISITVRYFCKDNDDNYHIDAEAVIPILKVNDVLETVGGELERNHQKYTINYIADKSILDLKAVLEDTFEDEEEVDNNPFNRHVSLTGNTSDSKHKYIPEDDDFEVDQSVWNTLESIFGESILEPVKKKKKKSKGKSHDREFDIPKSKVFKEAKNAKRDVKRHGVIISRDKDDIKHDEKVLRAFLKEFVPGKEDWLKGFRAELAERWMSMYTIRLKELKKLEKFERNKRKAKERRKRNKEILDFTRNMFTVPIDSWDDPNK